MLWRGLAVGNYGKSGRCADCEIDFSGIKCIYLHDTVTA